MRRRLLLLLPAIWFVALLSAPAVAWVAGERQPLLEQREKVAFPAINRSSVTNPEVYARFDRAILDRLPFRGDALRLKGQVALRAFGISPSQEVVPGTRGWLYMERDFRPCMPTQGPGADAADAVEIIARTIGASGRRAGVMLAGSKTGDQPEHLRGTDPALARCIAEREARVHERLRATPGGVDISETVKQERDAGRDVFLKQDSHWQGNIQLAFVRAMLDAVRPGLADEVGVEQVRKAIPRQADLTNMIGMPVDQDTFPPIARRSVKHPGARPGETLLIGDSQMRLALTDALRGRPPISDAALPGPVYCDRGTFPSGACTPLIEPARTILFEWVARDMEDITTSCWQFPTTLLPDLRKRVTPDAASLVNVADGTPIKGRLRLAAAPSVVRFAPDDGDVARSLRLMVVPVERLGTPQPGGLESVTVAQRPTDGKPVVSCTSFAAAAGQPVILPVPAGRSVAALGLELTGPPGTVFGTPQSFQLDDATVERGLASALRR